MAEVVRLPEIEQYVSWNVHEEGLEIPDTWILPSIGDVEDARNPRRPPIVPTAEAVRLRGHPVKESDLGSDEMIDTMNRITHAVGQNGAAYGGAAVQVGV